MMLAQGVHRSPRSAAQCCPYLHKQKKRGLMENGCLLEKIRMRHNQSPSIFYLWVESKWRARLSPAFMLFKANTASFSFGIAMFNLKPLFLHWQNIFICYILLLGGWGFLFGYVWFLTLDRFGVQALLFDGLFLPW